MAKKRHTYARAARKRKAARYLKTAQAAPPENAEEAPTPDLEPAKKPRKAKAEPEE